MQDEPPILKLPDNDDLAGLPGVTPSERRAIKDRTEAWAAALGADDDPINRDMVRLAVRSYTKIERLHDCDDAEAERRVRNCDMLWRREKAREVADYVARIQDESFIAVLGLESSVMGCDWLIGAFEGLLAAVDAACWTRENHELLRKLIRHQANDPKGYIRVPDIWFEKMYRFEEVLRYCNQPIAELPWEERVLTTKKLNDAYRHDEELLDRLREEARPCDENYTRLIREQIERVTALREQLIDQENFDRAQAKTRALFEDSSAWRARQSCLVDTERALTGFIKDLRTQLKNRMKDEAGEPARPVKPRGGRAKSTDPEPDPGGA